MLQAARIFGAEAVETIRTVAEENGVDFFGFVEKTIAALDALEAVQNTMRSELEANLGPDLWPAVDNALGLAHQIENSRRGLLSCMENDILNGQAAELVSNLFAGLAGGAQQFMSATITHLLGQVVAGFDDATVTAKIMVPFNAIMEQKREIFQMMGTANQAFMHSITQAMKARIMNVVADSDMVAANDTPTVH